MVHHCLSANFSRQDFDCLLALLAELDSVACPFTPSLGLFPRRRAPKIRLRFLGLSQSLGCSFLARLIDRVVRARCPAIIQADVSLPAQPFLRLRKLVTYACIHSVCVLQVSYPAGMRARYSSSKHTNPSCTLPLRIVCARCRKSKPTRMVNVH